MITKSQIKKIHTLKNILNINNDVYIDMLFDFGVDSSKQLSFESAQIFIEILEAQAAKLKGWKIKPKKYEQLNRDSIMASPSQLRMIEGLWRDVCYFDNDKFAKKSLRKFLHRVFNKDDVMFLTKKQASKVIQAIIQLKKNVKSAATL